MNQELIDLLHKKQKQSSGGGNIDWDDRRNKYQAAVERLYRQIEEILERPLAQNTVKLQRRKKDLTESYIGTYSIDDLILQIGDEQVRFSPRGRNIAGARGRVDVLGERGEAVLVLQEETGWEFVQSRQPAHKVVPFHEESFTEVLKLVTRD